MSEDTFTIAKAPLTLTVANATKVEGEADPAFRVTAEGLVNGEALLFAQVVRAEGEQAGEYALSVGDAYVLKGLLPQLATDNYQVSAVGGCLTVSPAAPEHAAVERLSGSNRYATMAAIVDAADYESCEVAVLASGKGYADALAAAGLAGTLGCPVLTTDPAGLSEQTAATLTEIGVKTVYIVGGTGAISAAVEADLAAMEISVERASGASRYATSVEAYKAGEGWSKTAIIVKGTDFPDALSIAPYAYASKSPIFLANGQGQLTDEVAAAIAEGGFENVLVIGGSGGSAGKMGVQDEAVEALGLTWHRLAGSNRYDTSDKVAAWATGADAGAAVQPEVLLSWDGMAVASGKNFPDALASVSLLGRTGSVLLLVPPTADSTDTVTLQRLHAAAKASGGFVETAYVLGGMGAVPAVVEEWLEAALN